MSAMNKKTVITPDEIPALEEYGWHNDSSMFVYGDVDMYLPTSYYY